MRICRASQAVCMDQYIYVGQEHTWMSKCVDIYWAVSNTSRWVRRLTLPNVFLECLNLYLRIDILEPSWFQRNRLHSNERYWEPSGFVVNIRAGHSAFSIIRRRGFLKPKAINKTIPTINRVLEANILTQQINQSLVGDGSLSCQVWCRLEASTEPGAHLLHLQ